MYDKMTSVSNSDTFVYVPKTKNADFSKSESIDSEPPSERRSNFTIDSDKKPSGNDVCINDLNDTKQTVSKRMNTPDAKFKVDDSENRPSANSTHEEPNKTMYGWFNHTPQCLQSLNRPLGLVALLGVANLILNFLGDSVAVVRSTLESAFSLSSQQSSWISNFTEIGANVSLVVCFIYGSRIHKPRWLTAGYFLVVVASVLFFLPHFLLSPKRLSASESVDLGLCTNRSLSTENSCSESKTNEEDKVMMGFLISFVLASFLFGMGNLPIVSAFLDDITTRDKFALYNAWHQSLGTFGSSIGYGLGGFLLSVHTDFLTKDTSKLKIKPSDPQWIGAWWPTYVIGGSALLVICAPLSGYPRDLPGAAKMRQERKTEAHAATEQDTDADANVSLRAEIRKNVRGVLRNPIFYLLTLLQISEGMLITTFTAFGPKYMEVQFGLTSSTAGMLFGGMTIPGGVGGFMFGGYIIKRFSLTVPTIFRSIMCVVVFSTLGITGLFLHCDEMVFYGVNTPYQNHTELTLNSSCNFGCTCASLPYKPVCSTNMNTPPQRFFSACHAGCSSSNSDNMRFGNCSCVSGVDGRLGGEVSIECGGKSCPSLYIFVVLFLLVMFSIYTGYSMRSTLGMRIITREQKYASMFVGGVASKILSFPIPLLAGAIFDNACELWRRLDCGRRGSCLRYGRARLSAHLFLAVLSFKLLSILLLALCMLCYRVPRIADVSRNEPSAAEVSGTDTSTQTNRPNVAAQTMNDKTAGNQESSHDSKFN